MLRCLLGVIQGLFAWVEQCPCRATPAEFLGYAKDDWMPDELGVNCSCPFPGRRALEMATGGIADLFEVVKNQNAAALLLGLRRYMQGPRGLTGVRGQTS